MYADKCVFVMPTWNTYKLYEEGKIPSTAHEVLKKLIDAIRKNLTKEQEIIIINDGSEDKTIEKIANLLKRKKFEPVQLPGRSFEESRIRRFKKPDLELTISILNFEDRRGFNMAVVKGYQQALRSKPVFVIKLDSDGQHLPKDFPELLEHAKKHPECKTCSSHSWSGRISSACVQCKYEKIKSMVG